MTPVDIAITPDGKSAYVANSGSNNVSVLTLATNLPGAPVTVDAGPLGLAVTPDGKTVYVSAFQANTVTPITVATNTRGTSIAVGKAPLGIAVSAGAAGPPPAAPSGAYTTVAASGVYHSANGLTFGTGNTSPNASLTLPPGALPEGTTVTIYVGNQSTLARLVPAGQTYLASFAVSWTAPDGSSPNATAPLSLTINDPRITTGAVQYQTTATGVQPVTGNVAAGKATFTFTVDPGFVVAAPSGTGYTLAASDGGIFNYGSAGFFGSAGALALRKPIVGVAPSAGGSGYTLVASDGGIFNYGDAGFFGSAGALNLNKPIVGIATTPTGKGYTLVASDGGIFNYGDAGFFGSAGALKLNKPIVGIASR